MKKIKIIIITTLLMLLSINLSFAMGMWEDYNSNNNLNAVYDNMELMNNENLKTVEFDDHMNNYNQNNLGYTMNEENNNNNKYWPMNTNIWSQLFSNDNREIDTLNNYFFGMEKEMDEHQNEFGYDMMDGQMGFNNDFNNYNTYRNYENNGWGMMR